MPLVYEWAGLAEGVDYIHKILTVAPLKAAKAIGGSSGKLVNATVGVKL